MKMTDKDKSIPTIPKGVWESSRPADKKADKCSVTTDLQGNGYPKDSPADNIPDLKQQ